MNENPSEQDRVDIAFKELMISLFGEYPVGTASKQITETQYYKHRREIEQKYQITQQDDDYIEWIMLIGFQLLPAIRGQEDI